MKFPSWLRTEESNFGNSGCAKASEGQKPKKESRSALGQPWNETLKNSQAINRPLLSYRYRELMLAVERIES
jgi:hypothetical protein